MAWMEKKKEGKMRISAQVEVLMGTSNHQVFSTFRNYYAGLTMQAACGWREQEWPFSFAVGIVKASDGRNVTRVKKCVNLYIFVANQVGHGLYQTRVQCL